MIRDLCFILFLSGCCLQLTATAFYVDPVNGHITNDGSIGSPWSTLEEVVSADLVHSYKYSVPYDPSNSVFVEFNIGAPITAGDTIFLLSGLHGDLFLRNYHNALPITIMAAPGHTPIVKSIRLQSGSNWNFKGLEVSSEPYGTYINYRLVFLETHGFQGPVSNVEISDCKVYSATEPWVTAQEWLDNVSSGIFADGDSIRIVNNQVLNIDMGITGKGDYITVVNNEVTNFSGDGLRLLGSYGLYEGNIVKNCYDVDDNHDDGFQSFVLDEPPFEFNILRRNTFINYEDPNQPLRGPLQGIACFDGFFKNWIIENNLVIVDHWHGISLYGATDCLIANNTVIDPTPDVTPGPSWIRINDHDNGELSSGNGVYNNISNSLQLSGATESNNSSLVSYADYQDHFVDYANYNFRLKEASPLIDAALDDYAPSIDLDSLDRPQGSHADIGCYEYVFTSSTKEVAENSAFKLFPNPVHDEVFIVMNGQIENAIVSIYQMDGKCIRKKTCNSSSTVINTSMLQNGIYLISIHDPVARTHSFQKMIKM